MAANIQAYLENIRKPWGQIYYDTFLTNYRTSRESECLILAVALALCPTT